MEHMGKIFFHGWFCQFITSFKYLRNFGCQTGPDIFISRWPDELHIFLLNNLTTKTTLLHNAYTDFIIQLGYLEKVPYTYNTLFFLKVSHCEWSTFSEAALTSAAHAFCPSLRDPRSKPTQISWELLNKKVVKYSQHNEEASIFRNHILIWPRWVAEFFVEDYSPTCWICLDEHFQDVVRKLVEIIPRKLIAPCFWQLSTVAGVGAKLMELTVKLGFQVVFHQFSFLFSRRLTISPEHQWLVQKMNRHFWGDIRSFSGIG